MFYGAYEAEDLPNVPKYPKNFVIEVIDYCQPASLDINSSWLPSSSLFYEAGDSPFETASLAATWTTVPTICNIEYRVTILPIPADP